jgi:hypothetical protein
VQSKSRAAARATRLAFVVTVAAAFWLAPTALASTALVGGPGAAGSPFALVAAVGVAPGVTLEAPLSPSNDLTPSFSGTASDVTTVTVEIFEGTRPEGEIVAVATATGTGGAWTSGQASPSLPGGRRSFTAIAIQKSTSGNAVGTSLPVAFSVDTEPPTVTLASPTGRSNDPSPTFSGAADEATPVTVTVFGGWAPEGEVVVTATAGPPGPGGGWTTDPVTPSLPDGTYTAIATQPSALGNPVGTSDAVTFTIDTRPPEVTLEQLPSPSPGAAAIFSGTASDQAPVTVEIYSGAGAEGPVVASASADVAAGEWASARLSPALPWGQYTAVASQPSSLGNATGMSAPMTFVVEPIPPSVGTEGASGVTRTTAALYGLVDPLGGGISSCAFEFGATTAYDRTIECGFVGETMSAFPPDTTAAVPVFVRIFGLAPSTTYHFRIAVVGEGGTAYGDDASFTTQAPFIFDEQTAPRPVPVTTPIAKHAVAANRVAALRAKQLITPARDTIASLLRRGVFKMPFTATEAGRVVVSWYYRQTSSKSRAASTAARVLVASGQLTFARASRRVVLVRLTKSGRRLMGRSSRLRLSATCAFSPVGEKPVRVSRFFELRR